MITNDRRRIDVQVQISYPTSNNGDDRRVSIRIEDYDASIQFVELEIPFADFTALMSTRAVVVPAQVGGFDRVGKRMEVDQTNTGRDEDEATRVRDDYLANGWDSAVIRRNNQGNHQVIARRWVEKDPADGGSPSV
jgi:hypothetical protein